MVRASYESDPPEEKFGWDILGVHARPGSPGSNIDLHVNEPIRVRLEAVSMRGFSPFES